MAIADTKRDQAKEVDMLKKQIESMQAEMAKMKDTMEQAKVSEAEPQPEAVDVPPEIQFEEPIQLEEQDRTEEEQGQASTSQYPTTADEIQRLDVDIIASNDQVLKDCMAWEKAILKSANLSFLKIDQVTQEYIMPSLPYPLLKHQMLLRRQKFKPNEPESQIGGYAEVSTED